ncbi:integrator complex subunit 2-like isoform X1 [Clytia hemisphaerica]|uniref:integrator complex subunit 2-like isoform X1 n=1 Tax=Clytia hemisphaerica TaxID=252671 RepID=UPI0034D4F150
MAKNNEDFLTFPTSKTFIAIQSADEILLADLATEELRIVLPTLVRTIYHETKSSKNEQFKTFQDGIYKCIHHFSDVENLLSILKIDFKTVLDDVSNEQQLRRKATSNQYKESQQHALLLHYEGSSPSQRMRIVLSEILRISMQLKDGLESNYQIDDCELFEKSVYLQEISDMLCIAFSELPYLLSAPDISEVFLRLPHGCWLLCKLVVNNPDCFDVVCSSILAHAKPSGEATADMETLTRMKTLKLLCEMNPQYRKILRAECVSSSKLAGLSIELTINSTQSDSGLDLVSFFTGLLLASSSKTKEWLSDYIKHVQKDIKENQRENTLVLFKRQLVKEMKMVISTLNANTPQSTGDETMGEGGAVVARGDSNPTMQGISIMRLYCAFKTIAGFKFSQEESEYLIDLITCIPCDSNDVSIRFIVVGLCTLVACAFLVSTPEREQKVTHWLRQLIEKSSTYQQEGSPSYGETLLLIAIHFHGHTLEPIIDLVASTLGIKLRPASLTKLKLLFTQTIFPEKVIAEHALTVPVTKNLNGNLRTFLPVHCIHQLLKSRVFTKYSISVKEWLFKQILQCGQPVHPLMMGLLETYVLAIVKTMNISKTTKQQRMSALQPFPEEDILAVFDPHSTVECCDKMTSQILLMMFSLLYQNALLDNMRTLVNNAKRPQEYSTHLYSIIPIKQLLMEVRSNERSYGHIYPCLLRLLTTHYPSLCLVEDWIDEEEEAQNVSTNQNVPRVMVDDSLLELFEPALEYHDTQKVITKLSRLVMLQPTLLIPHQDLVIALLPKMLEKDVPRKIQLLVTKLWMKLNVVIPRRLLHRTVNVLRYQPENIKYSWERTCETTDEEIQKDPLIVLRCDKRIFRSPPLFGILLRTLRGYLTASRGLLQHHILSNPLNGASRKAEKVLSKEKDRLELQSALVHAQESAALQILLEICLPSELEKKFHDYTSKSTLREIQSQVCCYLHQSFISDPTIAKLLHYQGYSADLLPMTTTGVPSIHICIDFVSELMNQPYLEKQLFAVQLISYLSLQYPIPKSFSMSRYVIQQMKDLLCALPVAKRNQFFVPALCCLQRICKAFPPIREEVVALLLQIGRIAISQQNKTSLTVSSSIRLRDEKLDDEENEEKYEEDFEMDIDGDEKPMNNNTSLDRGNHKDSQNKFLKYCSSEELVNETERTFQIITNFSLNEKLSLTSESNISVNEMSKKI